MAEGLIACATRGSAGEVYNLASGVETTIRELAELINELTGNPTPIALTPARDWDHSGQRFGSTEKARGELGFEAGTPLREGLERTIEWTRENLDWIERCMARHAERMPSYAGSRLRAGAGRGADVAESNGEHAQSDRVHPHARDPASHGRGRCPISGSFRIAPTSSTSWPSAT